MKRKFSTIEVLCILILTSTSLKGQDFCISNQFNFGGSKDDIPLSITKISDGYILCGYSNSRDGDFGIPANHHIDAFIAKFNYNNQIVWRHNYGGTLYDDFWNVKQTADGGFIVVGNTYSNDGDVSGNHGGSGGDVWIVKLNATGELQWQHCYGGNKDDHAFEISIIPSGFVVVGKTASNNNGDVPTSHGNLDAWVFSVTSNGNLRNSFCYGGSADDDAESLILNNNGSFTFCGSTGSNDGDVSGNHGGVSDMWLVNANPNSGVVNWQKCLGGSSIERGHIFAQTNDGNIVLDAGSYSSDGDVDGNDGRCVAWLVKVNPSTGNIIWNKTFKKPSIDVALLGAIGTSDGGVFAIGGVGQGFNENTHDAYVLKVNSNGTMQWEKILGGSASDNGAYWYSGIQVGTQFIVPIASASNDGDVLNAQGGYDAWVVTLARCVNSQEITIATKQNESNLNKLVICPNPSSHLITVRSEPGKYLGTICFFDASGKKVYEQFANSREMSIDIKFLSRGIYYLKSNKIASVTKFVKL